jgi:hypothetical protein
MKDLVTDKPLGTPEDYGYKIHAAGRGETGPETWTYMANRYGLHEEDEKDLYNYLQTVQELPAVVSHRVLERLYEVDVDAE